MHAAQFDREAFDGLPAVREPHQLLLASHGPPVPQVVAGLQPEGEQAARLRRHLEARLQQAALELARIDQPLRRLGLLARRPAGQRQRAVGPHPEAQRCIVRCICGTRGQRKDRHFLRAEARGRGLVAQPCIGHGIAGGIAHPDVAQVAARGQAVDAQRQCEPVVRPAALQGNGRGGGGLRASRTTPGRGHGHGEANTRQEKRRLRVLLHAAPPSGNTTSFSFSIFFGGTGAK